MSLAALLAGGVTRVSGVERSAAAQSAKSSTGSRAVHVIRIDDAIQRGTAAYVRRATQDAEEANAQALIVRLNTPGGRVDAALEIRDALLDAEVPTHAFVDRHAYSAGALVAIACEAIWMTPGAVMGAATPVKSDSGEKASEKMVSAVRSAFAATAEKRGREPKIAAAMVDASVAIEGVVEKGKLLSLTTERALSLEYAEGKKAGLDDVLTQVAPKARVMHVKPSPAEWLAGFVTRPAVASLLMSLGFLGLLFEIKTAGWGVGGTAALVFLGLFFWGHLLAGLAGWEGVILVVAGVALIAIEILVIPGVGIAGVLGGVCLLGGLYLSMVDFDDPTGQTFVRAAAALSGALLLLIVGGYAVLRWLPGARSLRGIVLQSRGTAETSASGSLGAGETERGTEAGPRAQVGDRGIARTDLRPAGVAEVGGHRTDVVTRGEYVESGTPIEVVDVSANRIVVERE